MHLAVWKLQKRQVYFSKIDHSMNNSCIDSLTESRLPNFSNTRHLGRDLVSLVGMTAPVWQRKPVFVFFFSRRCTHLGLNWKTFYWHFQFQSAKNVDLHSEKNVAHLFRISNVLEKNLSKATWMKNSIRDKWSTEVREVWVSELKFWILIYPNHLSAFNILK